MKMKNDEKIIIKATSDFSDLFRNVQKYSSFINHRVSKQTDQGFYLEIVPDGIIYFYKNLDVFLAINQPRRPSRQPTKNVSKQEEMEPNLLLKNVIRPENFPENGVSLIFKTYRGNVDVIRPVAMEHFESIHEDDVETSIIGENRLQVRFLSYRALYNYTSILSNLLNGLIEEYKSKSGRQVSVDL